MLQTKGLKLRLLVPDYFYLPQLLAALIAYKQLGQNAR